MQKSLIINRKSLVCTNSHNFAFMLNRNNAPAIKDALALNFHLQPCHTEILSNNIPLYWLNAGSQEVVQIEWVFAAGLWYESQTAVAATVAALLKNGTTQYNFNYINETIEYYGASLKATANNDFATISLHSLTKHLDKILPIVYEIIADAIFPENELRIFQKNAIQRLSVNKKKCAFVANRLIDVSLFGKEHPYGRYTEAEDLALLDTSILQAFHRKFYTPNNCKIFMAGNFSEKELTMVKSIFGQNWTDQISDLDITYNVKLSEEKKSFVINDKDGVQGAIRIGSHFPNRNHKDFVPLIVLNTLFGGYFGSRLMSNIREEKGYTYGIYSNVYAFKHNAALIISTEAGREVCQPAIEEVYKEMDILCNEAINEAELKLIKNYLLGTLLSDLDGPFAIMHRWKSLILNNKTEENFYNNVQSYKTVTGIELSELANKYFLKENFYELLVI